MAQFFARDFGAKGDGVTNDTLAIQTAIEAANAVGGGQVILDKGTYIVSNIGDEPSDGCLMLRDNISLVGAGMGETTLKVQDGSAAKITGVVRSEYGVGTNNFGMSDLTIDGNRANTTGKVDGWFNGFAPGKIGKDSNVTLERVEIKNCSGYGFDPHEQTENMVIRDSVAHGNGLDGFVADFLFDSTFENNVSYNNDRHGFNVVTSTYDFTLRNNIAYGNGGNGIVVQRGSENIPLPEGVVIEGGKVYGNGLEGVLIKLSNSIAVDGVEIYQNGREGIRLFGTSGNVITDNILYDNNQTSTSGFYEIRIMEFDDRSGVSGLLYPSSNNEISNNRIYSEGVPLSRIGIFERTDSSGQNTFNDNIIEDLPTTIRLGSPLSTINYNGAPPVETAKFITGTSGNDSLTGGSLADTISGGGGNDVINGNQDNDVLAGNSGDDTVFGGIGNDTITGDAGNDVIYGGDGFDSITGGSGNDIITGGSGDDVVNGNDGNDVINGGDGNDTISGSTGNDVIYGDDGDDIVRGDSGDDILHGGLGNDNISAGDGNDIVYGEVGNDSIRAGIGNDILYGGIGNDTMHGEDGNDILYGGIGNDSIIAGAGNDIVIGGADADTLFGGIGADVFKFTSISDSTTLARDSVRDFSQIEGDKLDFSGLDGILNFRGTAGFVGSGLELRYQTAANSTTISIDLNGDLSVDMQVQLSGAFALTINDFIL
jgi:parallel beta-helix repeat protein